MRRLYYVADDLTTVEAISDRMHHEGINDWHFHVVGKDEAGLYKRRIQSATTYQQLDVIHTGERWAMAGAAVGLGIGLLLLVTQSLPWVVNAFTVVLMTLVGGLFGAWQGGMVGLSRENYKLEPFHNDIEAGRFVIMIDLNREDKIRVRELMNDVFPLVVYGGADSTLINPFMRPATLYQQNTH